LYDVINNAVYSMIPERYPTLVSRLY